ncbi:MAG TPA: homoserine dehydrogenase [Candidatus Limnocylindria bacterium]|nr:homoserine dehydrogenase [Candidatus Limnocylindria bacterium]
MRVALLGLGTVGGAVASRLLDDGWRADVEARGLRPPALVAVGVREPGRQRAVEVPKSVDRTDDLAALVVRDDIDVVVELIGGLEPAGELVERALEAGKSVVTANKALLAELGPALERLARRSLVALRFEAAVAGGIPVLSPLARDLASTRINAVRGIVNGTTNFILSAMSDGGRAYEEVLADAQSRGYAEADPSGDVEGRDAAHKLVLLARLAFGVWPQPSGLRRAPAKVGGDGSPGITGVSAADIGAAAERGHAIKLIAFAGRPRGEAAGRLVGWVEPCAVSQSSLLGSTDGVLNAVEVLGWPLGRLALQGPGAGADATSNAVLADLLALVRGEGSTWAALPEALPLGELDAGHGQPVRWFWREGGRGCLSEPLTLDDARASLADRLPADTTLYRVLEAD